MKACLRLAEDTQNQHGSVVVLDIRPMDNDRQYQAKCVDNDMAFASVDLLSSIVTPLATDLRRFDGLTVDDRRTGGFLAPQATPKHVPERIVNSLPDSVVAPTKEDTVDRLPFGKFPR